MNYISNEMQNIYITTNKQNYDLIEKNNHPNIREFISILIRNSFKYKISNKKIDMRMKLMKANHRD